MTDSRESFAVSKQSRSAIRIAFLTAARQVWSIFAMIQTFLTRLLIRVPDYTPKGIIQRILIINLDELGDLVMAWPLINALKSRAPEVELTLLVNQSVLGITEGMDDIRVIGVDVKCHKLLRPFVLPIRHYRFVRKRLRNEQFDVCLLPRRDSDDVAATILAYFTKANRRVSFSEKSTSRKSVTNRSFDLLLTDVIPAPPIQHETMTNLSLLSIIGFSPSVRQQRFPLSEIAVHFAEDSLPASDVPFVAICPTSGHSKLKQWGVQRFAEVASQLTLSGIPVILIGGLTDELLGSTIQDACRGKCLNFIGKTSLAQMAALLAKCSAFLGNDAGPMHVASALGIATLGVFGSSCWHQFGPWAPTHSVIASEISCSPCHGHVKNRCDVCIYSQPICLHQLTTTQVFKALLNLTPKLQQRFT